MERWEELDEQESLREVCRRYLRTYGPATPKDFGEWFASRQFKPAEARALFDSIGSELEVVDVEGHEAFVLAGDTDFPEPAASVRLLSEYDVYVMGFRERDQLVPDAARLQVAAHGRGKYEGPAGVRFLMIDGIAAGLWDRKKRGKAIELRVTPSRKLTRAERVGIDAEAERIGAFLGLEPVLTCAVSTPSASEKPGSSATRSAAGSHSSSRSTSPSACSALVSMGTGGAKLTGALKTHANPTLTEEGIRTTLEMFVVDKSLVTDELVSLRYQSALNDTASDRLALSKSSTRSHGMCSATDGAKPVTACT